MQLSQFKNYEFIGLFYVKDYPNMQFSEKISYNINNGLEVLFLSPKSLTKKFDKFIDKDLNNFNTIYRTLMSVPEQETKYVKLKNLLYSPGITSSTN